jgi:hypothetical protein
VLALRRLTGCRKGLFLGNLNVTKYSIPACHLEGETVPSNAKLIHCEMAVRPVGGAGGVVDIMA